MHITYRCCGSVGVRGGVLSGAGGVKTVCVAALKNSSNIGDRMSERMAGSWGRLK